MTERTATPTLCQSRPLLQDWALSNLLASALTRINSQAASPGERAWNLGAGECPGFPTLPTSSFLPPHLSFPTCQKSRAAQPMSKDLFCRSQEDSRAGSELEASICRFTFQEFKFHFFNEITTSSCPWAPQPFSPCSLFFPQLLLTHCRIWGFSTCCLPSPTGSSPM